MTDASLEAQIALVWKEAPHLLPQVLLDPLQLRWHYAFHKSVGRKYVVNCSRRLGKSYWCVVECVVAGMTIPRGQIKYGAPTQEQVHEITGPLLAEVLEQCPKELRPSWHSRGGCYVFPTTGAELRFIGCDNPRNRERLRGAKCHLGIPDEAGSIEEVDYVVNTLLMPQCIDTGGKILIPSTPPVSAGHPYARLAAEAKAEGRYQHATIYEGPRYTPAIIEEFKREAGGEKSTTWRREYLAEFVVDETRAVVPEWIDAAAECTAEVTTPHYYDRYNALDLGFVNASACLLGHVDFLEAKLCITHEWREPRQNSSRIAEAVKLLESVAWCDARETELTTRVCDVDLIVIDDLQTTHKLGYQPTEKYDKESAVNAVRLLVQARKILIHPRCQKLLAELEHAVWNKQRTKYEQTEDGLHFDLLDALVYLVRSVRWNHNPYPEHWKGEDPATHWMDARTAYRRKELLAAAFSAHRARRS